MVKVEARMSRNVLVVDDSRTVRNFLELTLSHAGYLVCSAANGREALNLVEIGTFDLLVTDLNMPEMDGINFIANVRKIPGQRFVPIIILSGDTSLARKDECIAAGASAYLMKPFRQNQFLGILKMVIPGSGRC